MSAFRTGHQSARLSPPSYRRGLRVEWLEDRTTPAAFFVSNQLLLDANLGDAGGTRAGFVLTDRDGNGRLTDGDGVTADVPGLGTTTFTFRTNAAGRVTAGDGGVAFASIGQALRAAALNPGTDDVYVGPGAYAESLAVTTPVNLTGTTGTATDVTITPPTGAGVTITAGGVTLRNLEVSGAAGAGVTSSNVVDLTLDNVRVDGGAGVGLDLYGVGAGATLSLSGVVVTGNAGGGGTVAGFAAVDVVAGGVGGAAIAATGTSVQVTSAGAAGQVIDLTGTADLDLTGTAAGDTFVITPAAAGGAAISVNGGGGTGTDVIDLTDADGLAVAATPGATGFSGTITPAAGPTIDFTGVDQFADGSSIRGQVAVGGAVGSAGIPVPGATVFVDLTGDGTLGDGDLSTVTDAGGNFTLAGLPPLAGGGAYSVLIQGLAGTTLGELPAQAIVVGGLGAVTPAVTFEADLTAGGVAGGVVFADLDGDGRQDGGENPVAGVRVYLDLNQNGALDAGEPSAVSGATGAYNLATLANDAAVNLQVAAPLPAGFALPSPFAPATLSLTGGAALTQGVGVRQPGAASGGTVTGFVYGDLNNNGTRDAGENGVGGVTVYLDLDGDGRADVGEPTGRTGGTGGFTLATDQNGNFGIGAVLPPGFVQPGGAPAVVMGGGAAQAANVRLVANLPPQAAPARVLAAGVVQNGQARAQVFAPNGALAADVPVFAGLAVQDVRVTMADVTGDGVADVIVGTGPGVPTRVVVLDGTTYQEVARLAPFETAFTGGVYVSAGDLTGDGIAELVVTPDEGGGPRVLVYRGGAPGADGSFAQLASFFGIDDPNFRGGARAAVADLNRDGTPDLVVAAGFGGGPRVALYDGRTVLSGPLTRLVNDFFVFEDTLRNGAFVAAGDVDGDGFADLIAGGGPGGGPRVLALSGAALVAAKALDSRVLGNFFAGDSADRGGVRVAATDLDGDGRADVSTGSGRGDAVQQLRAFLSDSLGQQPVFGVQFETDDLGGVFVG